MINLTNKKILITGGSGFLGGNLVRILKENHKIKDENLFILRQKQCDLRDLGAVKKALGELNPDIIMHLATVSGGIGFYREHPAKVFDDVLTMGANVLEASKELNVEKLVITGSALIYPKDAYVPFEEKDIWKGYPEESEAAYGLACRAVLSKSAFYRKEYGLNSIYLILSNLYGPGYNFKGDQLHFLPSLIKKFDDAMKKKELSISLWGSGKVTKDFLYVDDAAEGIIQSLLRYDSDEALNIGSGVEIRLRDIAEQTKKVIGFKGEIIWDASKPEGRIRKYLNISSAKSLIGLNPKIDLKDGLEKTVKAYFNR